MCSKELVNNFECFSKELITTSKVVINLELVQKKQKNNQISFVYYRISVSLVYFC